jgi:hypothetical protein
MLIKISSGDIGLDKPTDFAVYSIDGKLLLQKGHVITSEGLLERLYRLGHREGPAAATRAGSRNAAGRTQTPTQEESNQLLFGTAHLPENHSTGHMLLPNKSPVLPDLAQKVEFFHLTPEGGKEPLRVELTGVITGTALIVRCTGNPLPVLEAGVTYEARLFTGSRLFKFNTQLLPDSAAPFGCYFLHFPETVAQATVRKHHRVATSFGGKLHSGEYQRPVADVVVENVSSTGAGVSTKEDLLLVGQNARLTMNLTIENRVRPVSVFVEVRNRRPEGDSFKYGVEFVRMPDEVRRDIKDFVLDSMAAV